MDTSKPKILTVDIETRPALSYHWRMFKENISIEQNVEPTETMCIAAKWLGEDKVYFWSTWTGSKYEMMKGIYDLLVEADAVVGWHSQGFDIKHIETELLVEGMKPLPPLTNIDLFKTVKGKMFFLSNKLDFVAQSLKIGKKKEHEGFMLWRGCLEGNEKAQQKMKEYNIQDVILTEKMYLKMRPFISNHPYIRPSQDGSLECPNCHSKKRHKRGYRYTGHYRIQRYQCQNDECGRYYEGARTKTTNKAKLEEQDG